MALNKIFNRINSNYNTVEALANSIYTPYKLAIDAHYAYLDRFVEYADY